MDGILIYRDPVKGMVATVGIELEEAQRIARERAQADYPNLQLHDAWLIYSWHLMEDQGGMFVAPKPWPIASFYEMTHALELNDGKLFEWLVLLASSSESYNHHFLPSKDEARRWLVEVVGPHGAVVVDNEAGGLTVTWTTPDREEVIVAFAIPINPS